MATRVRKPDWPRVMARLRRGVAARDIASIRDLGLTLEDGIQDRSGRSLVRRNPATATSTELAYAETYVLRAACFVARYDAIATPLF
jgi:hypothetical protein